MFWIGLAQWTLMPLAAVVVARILLSFVKSYALSVAIPLLVLVLVIAAGLFLPSWLFGILPARGEAIPYKWGVMSGGLVALGLMHGEQLWRRKRQRAI
jgi:hypothetical protein